MKYIIHTDGGSRGNPGPAAVGVVIEGEIIRKAASPEAGEPRLVSKWEYGEYIGETTNNEAEYRAVIFALKKLKQLVGSEKTKEAVVDFLLDSELVVRQLSGEYKIKEKGIQGFFIEVWNLKIDFGGVSFNYIPREKNKAADKIVNQVLDKETSPQSLTF